MDGKSKGKITLSLIKDGGLSKQHRRQVLKGEFNLKAHETVSFSSELHRLDISRAEWLEFHLRMIPETIGGGTVRLTVALRDYEKTDSQRSFLIKLNTNRKGWGDVRIPMTDFKNLDTDQLMLMRITLSAQALAVGGQFYLDDILFGGSGNILFDSHRDNIVGFPTQGLQEQKRKQLLAEPDDRKMLLEIARDTWKYFENAREKNTGLISDHIRTGASPLIADYTSITNIGLDIMAIISAERLGFIDATTAKNKIETIVRSLEAMEKYKNFFYNFYDIKKLAVTRSYISTVDSGWLAVALVILRQAFPEPFAQRVSGLLDAFDFGYLLDPENNHLVVGIEIPEKEFGKYHYGMLVSEARAASYLAIGKGDVPKDHWWFLYRTPPEAWRWQNQAPKGNTSEVDGIEFIQGYYLYQGQKFVPSWGGSLFEFLMPTLVLKERELAPKGLGLNGKIAVEMHKNYALKDKKYPVWGISPAATENGKTWRYAEFGVKELSVKGYRDEAVITPHVTFLALDAFPEEAILNIRKLLMYPIYGEYGFYDSISFRHSPQGSVNSQYLALDQGMTLVALCNYLKDGAIQNLFHQDPIGKKPEELLVKEDFFKE